LETTTKRRVALPTL